MIETFNVMLPSGKSYAHIEEMLKQTHILIAGTTGSGKSTLVNDLIYHLLYRPFGVSDGHVQMILIDPKRVELSRYAKLDHTLFHATERDDIRQVLKNACLIMDDRFRDMQRKGIRMYDGGDIYVIIDEYADICDDKEIVSYVIRLAQLGRASKIHLWLCTQRPTRDVITGRIKVNMDCRIALRVSNAQDSRNIINVSGAERIPRYDSRGLLGGLFVSPDYDAPMSFGIPFITDSELSQRVRHWEEQSYERQISLGRIKKTPRKRSLWEELKNCFRI